MERELIVNATREGVAIAMLEDRRLIEYHTEKEDSAYNVGDIYLGRVRKINPGLNAAFVNVGHEKDAFLHYTDLAPHFRSLDKYVQQSVRGSQTSPMLAGFRMEPEIVKTGKINTVLDKQKVIMVQVLKEPISTKGPRITCEISLPGRYLVLTPFNKTIGISRRLSSAQERTRLQRLLESIVPPGFGVIARTACEGKSVQVLHEDLQELIDTWQGIHAKLKGASPPHVLFSESAKLNTLIRDILSPEFTRIVVNDLVILHEIKTYIRKIAPEKEKIVQFHQGRKPIFDAFDVTRQIKSLFGRTVVVRSGAYLIIEHTEALHVIDINSGPKIARKGDQEQNAYKVNIETAAEVARQLRLRDLGGIIIVDFIDMKNSEHKKEVYKAMRDAMKEDRARHTVLPVSKFGLMQITRQRVRPEVNMDTAEVCPTCRGTGKVEATLLISDEVEHRLEEIMLAEPKGKVRLHVHPFIEAYLKRGWFRPRQRRWLLRYRRWISVRINASYGLTEFKFLDGNDQPIQLIELESAAKALTHFEEDEDSVAVEKSVERKARRGKRGGRRRDEDEEDGEPKEKRRKGRKSEREDEGRRSESKGRKSDRDGSERRRKSDRDGDSRGADESRDDEESGASTRGRGRSRGRGRGSRRSEGERSAEKPEESGSGPRGESRNQERRDAPTEGRGESRNQERRDAPAEGRGESRNQERRDAPAEGRGESRNQERRDAPAEGRGESRRTPAGGDGMSERPAGEGDFRPRANDAHSPEANPQGERTPLD